MKWSGVRFFSKGIPGEEIKVQLILLKKKKRRERWEPIGDVEVGDGLTLGADGRLSVKLGDGLKFDDDLAVASDTQMMITENDLLDEDETEQDLQNILLSEQGQPG